MKKAKLFCLLLILLQLSNTYSQIQNIEDKGKITSVLENYFQLEREAIHIHLDKTTFINNEAVWYQGYIINRHTKKPFFTSNVYVLLLDEKGKQVSEQLVYASNGAFSGKIDLGAKLKSGNYFIQVYTNWMNNFNEDESTIAKINVINPLQGLKDTTKLNTGSLALFLTPEGNSLVTGISNAVGVQLRDCSGNSPENLEALIQNSRGEVIQSIRLNRFGFGKFDITPDNEKIKVVVRYKDMVVEKEIPASNPMGISLAVNSFSRQNQTAFKIKTTAITCDALQLKKLNIVIHQDQKALIYPLSISPNNLEETIVIDNSLLEEGVNTVRIIDSDLRQWSERLFYVGLTVQNNFSIAKNKRHEDKIGLVGYSGYPNAISSISILPEATQSVKDGNSIIAGLKINPYLNLPLTNTDYYLSSNERLKFYELDLALLNQPQSKYNWDFMKLNRPSSNYSFDMGIDLKGSIRNDIRDKDYHKVKMVSYANKIMITRDVSTNGEYVFDHMLLEDSAYVSLSLHKLPKFDPVTNLFKPQILNRKKPFYKPFKITQPEGCSADDESYITDFDLPKLSSKIIKLKEIEIQNNHKNDLVYEKKIGNLFLKGYKIDENMHDLFVFLQSHGFNVVRGLGTITIYSGGTFSIDGSPAIPQIFLDDSRIFSPDELTSLSMSDIDEIYLDKRATVPGLERKQGIIKIYTKKVFQNYNEKKDPNSFYLTGGFARFVEFKNVEYDNPQSQGFDNFGIIDWKPQILADENGQFIFETTDLNKIKCKIIVEGMTNEGRIFHEERIVELK